MNFYLPSGAVRTGLPVGFIQSNRTGEPLWQDDSVQAKKSSSTGDIHEEDGEGLRRRLSLPGLLSQGDLFFLFFFCSIVTNTFLPIALK